MLNNINGIQMKQIPKNMFILFLCAQVLEMKRNKTKFTANDAFINESNMSYGATVKAKAAKSNLNKLKILFIHLS